MPLSLTGSVVPAHLTGEVTRRTSVVRTWAVAVGKACATAVPITESSTERGEASFEARAEHRTAIGHR